MQKIPMIGPRQLVAHFGSQRAAGEALGVTQQAVSKWVEKRRIPPQWRAVAALAMGRVAPSTKEGRTTISIEDHMRERARGVPR